MNKNVLIGAVAVIAVALVIIFVVLPGLPTVEPEPAFEGERDIDDGFYELSLSWNEEGFDLDTLDLSDDAAIKALGDAKLEKVKTNLDAFKAGMNPTDYPDQEALEALADVYKLKVDLVAAQKAYLLAEDQANITAQDGAVALCGKMQATDVVGPLEDYMDAYETYITQANDFVLSYTDEGLRVGMAFKGEEENAFLDSLRDLYSGYSVALANC